MLYIFSISFGANIFKFILFFISVRPKWYVGVVIVFAALSIYSSVSSSLQSGHQPNDFFSQIPEQNPFMNITNKSRGYLLFSNKSHGGHHVGSCSPRLQCNYDLIRKSYS